MAQNQHMQHLDKPSWTVIVNPFAGNGKAGKKWPKIRQFLDQHLHLQDVFFTTCPGDAAVIARRVVASGQKYIIGVGGDGTNFEIINGFFSPKSDNPQNITYALLPIGTGNDWIRHHRIPRKLKAWVEMIQREKTTLHDIGWIDLEGIKRKYFINVCGLAYDAFVVKYLQPWRRWMIHPIVYMLGILRCLYLYKLPGAAISIDGREPLVAPVYTINAGICRYSGGGLQIVPHALSDDGKLAVTIAPELTKMEVLLNTPRFYTGTIAQHPKIITRQADTLHVSPSDGQEIWVEADGELLGKAPVTIGILPAALRIVVP